MLFNFAAAALVATTAASGLVDRDFDVSLTRRLNDTADVNLATAKVVNRCSYPVYLWSIDKQYGCAAAESVELKTGQFYHENYQNGTDGGISIKISKWDTCGGKDITQLEYKIDYTTEYAGNYLDMSFVDCLGNLEDCPGRTDGFYLKSGNKPGSIHVSAVNNEHCPIFNVYNAEEAAKVSYIKWDDRQTKFCDASEPLELYLCGGEAPDEDDTSEPVASSSAAPSSTEAESSSTPVATSSSSTSIEEEPTSSAPAPTSSAEEDFVVAAAAAVTPAPVSSPPPVIKTEVVYVTEYVNKRHAHGRRHQHFHA